MSKPVNDIRDVSPAELGNSLQRLFPLLTVERAQWVLGQLTERVECKRIAEIIGVEATHSDAPACTAIAVVQPANAASLLAIGSHAGARHAEYEVMGRLLERLQNLGIRFLQATTDTEQDEQRLRRLGFEHLAKLAVMVLDAENFSLAEGKSRSTLLFQPVDGDPEMVARVCHTAELSFVETSDCPRLSRFRTPTEIVDGYRKTPTFDPGLWRLATIDGNPAGCLILTPHRVNSTFAEGRESSVIEAIEISYMGLVPKYRKRGLGHVLLNEAVAIARHQNASRMVLAVDRENSRAISLYRRNGWIEVTQESVWGMKIDP